MNTSAVNLCGAPFGDRHAVEPGGSAFLGQQPFDVGVLAVRLDDFAVPLVTHDDVLGDQGLGHVGARIEGFDVGLGLDQQLTGLQQFVLIATVDRIAEIGQSGGDDLFPFVG